MFGDNKNKNTNAGNDIFAANTIQNGTLIEGNINAEGNVRIDGKLEGNLTTKSKLVVGNTGVILGDIKCENANVEGKIEGNVYVSGILLLKSTAVINGDIFWGKLVVEQGAEFIGRSAMNSKGSKSISNEGAGAVQKQIV
ncbi:MAG: polymer-forming cytoskeletal protein [Chitinophagales bacterium]|nr:polymer-forming cytoskeletal protein [Chitinophagales bacterium]